HGGLLREQSLCALVQRGAASRAQAERRAGDRALPGPGADWISGTRGHERRRPSTDSHALRRAGGERRLPRPHARPPRGGSRLRESRSDNGGSLYAAPHFARPHRAPAARPALDLTELESARADKLGLLPPPRVRGRGGGELKCSLHTACPLPVPPAEVGCFRRRPVNKVAELG